MIETAKNIGSRLNFATGVVLISVALTIGALLFSFEKNRYLSKLETERKAVEIIIAQNRPSDVKVLSRWRKEEAARVLRQIASHENILGAGLYDSDGHLIARDIRNMRNDSRDFGLPPDLSSIRDRNEIPGIGRFGILVKPFVSERGSILHIGAVYSVEQIERDFEESVAVWFSAVAAAMLFAFFAIRIFMERTVTGPVRKLTEVVRSYAGKGFPVGTDMKKENELEAAFRWFESVSGENVRMKRELSNLNMVIEEKVRERTKQSEEANRAKTAFLANMSHELRTPLNAILGFTDIISKKPDLPEEIVEQLSIVRRSGEYLLLLINEVLDMSKIEAGQMELDECPMDLHRLLWELENMFKMKAANKELEFAFRLDENLPRYILADELKLRQVMTNIIDNAVKFTSEGGVRLRARVADRDSFAEAETAVCFEVEDTGVGISPDEKDNLFKAFVQTRSGRRSGQGTGLGLAISYRFVKMMRGEIDVESVPGKGSKFLVTIPLRTILLDDIETSDPQKDRSRPDDREKKKRKT